MLGRALAAEHLDYILALYLARYAGLRIHECFRIDTAAAKQALRENAVTVKGKGGKIRVQARSRLARMKGAGEIRDYIPGEEFSIFNSATLATFRRCGALRKDPDLERHNNGVTIILL